MPNTFTWPLRRLRQMRAIAALLAFLAIAAIWIGLPGSWRITRRIEIAAWSMLLAGFGIRLAVRGEPCPGAMQVANHVSWADIALLARLSPAAFVAKAEVGSWPVIGKLAGKRGCIFTERNRRGGLVRQIAALRARDGDGAGVILFPEGTTSDGTGLLPFRSSLLALLEGPGDRYVQPVTIEYRAMDGSLLDPQSRRRIAWLDEDTLLSHAMELAAMGGVLAIVHFDQPVVSTCRKRASAHCHAVIAARLAAAGGSPVQAAALKRAA